MVAEEAAQLEPGRVLAERYEVRRQLSTGPAGAVWEVYDRTTEMAYALRTLPPLVAGHQQTMASLAAHFRVTSRLTHPAIAATRFLEADKACKLTFILGDLCGGQTLRAWLDARKGQPAPRAVALGILRQVAAALDYAHSGQAGGNKVLHRDLRPEAIHLEPPRKGDVPIVRVSDFTLAAEVQESLITLSTEHIATAWLDVPPPSPYIAPEQWEGRAATAAVDQWALAVIAFELLTGQRPFAGATPAELRAAVLAAQVPAHARLTAGDAAVLAKALARDRRERHATCTVFVDALEGSSAPRPAPAVPIAAAAAVGLLLVGLAFVPRSCRTDNIAPPPTSAPPPTLVASVPAPVVPAVGFDDRLVGRWKAVIQEENGSTQSTVLIDVRADGSYRSYQHGVRRPLPDDSGTLQAQGGNYTVLGTNRNQDHGVYVVSADGRLKMAGVQGDLTLTRVAAEFAARAELGRLRVPGRPEDTGRAKLEQALQKLPGTCMEDRFVPVLAHLYGKTIPMQLQVDGKPDFAPCVLEFLNLTCWNDTLSKRTVIARVRIPGLTEWASETLELPIARPSTVHLVPPFTKTLCEVREQRAAQVEWEVVAGPHKLASGSIPLTVASINDVPLSDDTACWLTALITHGDPVLDEVLSAARKKGYVSALFGYQGTRDDVIRQLAAIYDILSELGLHYSSRGGIGGGAQRMYFPRESLAGEGANCVDGTILMAALCERISLETWVALAPSHAYLVVSLTDPSRGDPKLWAIETTKLGNSDKRVDVGGGRLSNFAAEAFLPLEAQVKARGLNRLLRVRQLHRGGIEPFPFVESMAQPGSLFQRLKLR